MTPDPEDPTDDGRSSWGRIYSKVAAGGAAGALTFVLVWAASLAGVEVPPEVASAVTVLISFAAGYLKPETH